MDLIIEILIIGAVLLGLYMWAKWSIRKTLEPGGEKSDPVVFHTLIGSNVKKRAEKVGYEGLTGEEKVLYCVDSFWRMVSVGGFKFYYSEEDGKYAKDTVEAFERIGAARSADILRRANAIFGQGGPASDKEMRREHLRQLGKEGKATLKKFDNEFYKCDENWHDSLAAFIAERRENFSET